MTASPGSARVCDSSVNACCAPVVTTIWSGRVGTPRAVYPSAMTRRSSPGRRVVAGARGAPGTLGDGGGDGLLEDRRRAGRGAAEVDAGLVPVGENGRGAPTGVRASSWVQLPAPRLLCSMPAPRSSS